MDVLEKDSWIRIRSFKLNMSMVKCYTLVKFILAPVFQYYQV